MFCVQHGKAFSSDLLPLSQHLAPLNTVTTSANIVQHAGLNGATNDSALKLAVIEVCDPSISHGWHSMGAHSNCCNQSPTAG